MAHLDKTNLVSYNGNIISFCGGVRDGPSRS